MDHSFAWRRKLWVLLFAVVAVTACQKAPAPQSEAARGTPQLTGFSESSLSPAHTAAAKELQGSWKVTEFHTARGASAVEEGANHSVHLRGQ